MNREPILGDYSGLFQIESHTWSHPQLDTLIDGNGTTPGGLPTTLEKEMRVPRLGLTFQEMRDEYNVDSTLEPLGNGNEALSTYLKTEDHWIKTSDTVKINKPITHVGDYEAKYLAYPFGRITPPDQKRVEVMKAAQTAGYKMAFIIDWPRVNGQIWKLHNIYAIPRMEMTLETWIHPGDPRSQRHAAADGTMIKPPNFSEQIRQWKQTYRKTLLRAHDPNPSFLQGAATLDTIKN